MVMATAGEEMHMVYLLTDLISSCRNSALGITVANMFMLVNNIKIKYYSVPLVFIGTLKRVTLNNASD